MNSGIVASRYAKALLMLSEERKVKEEVYQEAKALLSVLTDAGTTAALPQLSPIMTDFLALVAAKGRMNNIVLILSSFILQYRKSEKIAAVSLVTAVASGTADEVVTERLKQMGFDAAEITHSVNPDLIGGFKLQIEDKLMDASVATMLKAVGKTFAEKGSSSI